MILWWIKSDPTLRVCYFCFWGVSFLLVLITKNKVFGFFLYLQLVLEEVSVSVEKIRKQINPCMNARRVINMIQLMYPHMRKWHPIGDKVTRNTDLLCWLVSVCFCVQFWRNKWDSKDLASKNIMLKVFKLKKSHHLFTKTLPTVTLLGSGQQACCSISAALSRHGRSWDMSFLFHFPSP